MSINDNITGFAPAGQITPDPENTIGAPNTLTPDASTPIGTPDTVTPVGAGSITAPNTINPDAVNDVSAPNTLTPDAVNNVDTPNTLAPDAVNPIATPVGFAPLNSEPINRVLTPLIGLNFGSQNYSVMGQPSTFDSALTYSRASSATYVETYVDALNRKQKRITTVGANVPRFEDAGLLVEGASTNLCTFSELLNASGGYSATGTTSSINAGIAPDGSNSALQLNEDTSNGVHRIFKSLTVASGVKYTVSIYAKSISQTFLALPENVTGGTSAGVTYFNLTNGEMLASLVDVSIENVGNGWFRCSKTYTTTATAFAPQFILSNGSTTSYLGEGKSILLWGAQVEALPFATSYIKTEGSVVSRSGDACSAPISIEKGNLTAEAKSLGQPTGDEDCVVSITNGTNTNYIAILATQLAESARAYIVYNAALSANLFASGETFNELNILSLNFSSGSATAFIGDSDPVTDETVTIPSVNILQIGRLNTVLPFYGNIKRIEIYDTALTANEVKSL